jgi:hypothetical protein
VSFVFTGSNHTIPDRTCRTHLLEYTLVIVPVISIGHLSTTALAAISLGSMTASVSGFSIIQGFCSALDTLLPSAWTSSHPQYVGLWVQRMCKILPCSTAPFQPHPPCSRCRNGCDAGRTTLLSRLRRNLTHSLSLPAYSSDLVQRGVYTPLPEARRGCCSPSSGLPSLDIPWTAWYVVAVFILLQG